MSRNFLGSLGSPAGSVSGQYILNAPFSFAFWIYTVTQPTTAQGGFTVNNTDTPNGAGWALAAFQMPTNTIRFYMPTIINFDFFGAMTAGQWYHLAITSGSGTTSAYVNGALNSTSPHVPANIITPDGFSMNGNYVDNYTADFGMWNVVLSSTQIAQLAAGYRPADVNSANLVAWWPLGGYQSPEPDLSGNNNKLTLTANITQAPMPPNLGRGGRNFVHANSSYVKINAAPVTGAPISIAMWVNPTDKAANYEYFAITDNSAGNLDAIRFEFDYSGGTPLCLVAFRHAGAQDAVGLGTGSILAGVWQHFCGTVSAGLVCTMYINGVSFSIGALTKTPTGLVQCGIGAYLSGANVIDPANAQIADVAIWNTVLTGSQVSQLVAGARPNTVQSANLQGWWPLNGSSNSTESDLSGNANNGTLSPGSASGPLPAFGPPQTWRLT